MYAQLVDLIRSTFLLINCTADTYTHPLVDLCLQHQTHLIDSNCLSSSQRLTISQTLADHRIESPDRRLPALFLEAAFFPALIEIGRAVLDDQFFPGRLLSLTPVLRLPALRLSALSASVWRSLIAFYRVHPPIRLIQALHTPQWHPSLQQYLLPSMIMAVPVPSSPAARPDNRMHLASRAPVPRTPTAFSVAAAAAASSSSSSDLSLVPSLPPPSPFPGPIEEVAVIPTPPFLVAIASRSWYRIFCFALAFWCFGLLCSSALGNRILANLVRDPSPATWIQPPPENPLTLYLLATGTPSPWVTCAAERPQTEYLLKISGKRRQGDDESPDASRAPPDTGGHAGLFDVSAGLIVSLLVCLLSWRADPTGWPAAAGLTPPSHFGSLLLRELAQPTGAPGLRFKLGSRSFLPLIDRKPLFEYPSLSMTPEHEGWLS
jgi:hypothetical protein